MHAMRTDVAHLQNPLFAQLALEGQVPLLRARGDEAAGNGQNKQVLRRNKARAAVGAAVVRELRCVVAGKALQHAKTRDESGIKNVPCGKSVEVGAVVQTLRWSVWTRRRKERAETSGVVRQARNRQKWRLERELVDRAHIFTHIIN